MTTERRRRKRQSEGGKREHGMAVEKVNKLFVVPKGMEKQQHNERKEREANEAKQSMAQKGREICPKMQM